jgi:hypothetical protein
MKDVGSASIALRPPIHFFSPGLRQCTAGRATKDELGPHRLHRVEVKWNRWRPRRSTMVNSRRVIDSSSMPTRLPARRGPSAHVHDPAQRLSCGPLIIGGWEDQAQPRNAVENRLEASFSFAVVKHRRRGLPARVDQSRAPRSGPPPLPARISIPAN